MENNKLIDFVNISKSYQDNLVLDELNLYIRENDCLDQVVAEKLLPFVF